MDYYFSKTITASFDEAIRKTTDALKTEGFGIISDIDIQAKLNEKLVRYQNQGEVDKAAFITEMIDSFPDLYNFRKT